MALFRASRAASGSDAARRSSAVAVGSNASVTASAPAPGPRVARTCLSPSTGTRASHPKAGMNTRRYLLPAARTIPLATVGVARRYAHRYACDDPSCTAFAASLRSLQCAAYALRVSESGSPCASAAAAAAARAARGAGVGAASRSPSMPPRNPAGVNPASSAAATCLCTSTSGYRRMGEVKCVYLGAASA